MILITDKKKEFDISDIGNNPQSIKQLLYI